MTLVKYSIQISHNGKTLIDQSGEKEVPAEEALELSSSLLNVVGGVVSHAPTKPLRKMWTENELSSIMSAESAADAVEMFFKANPHSTRTRRAVEKAFDRHVIPPTLSEPVLPSYEEIEKDIEEDPEGILTGNDDAPCAECPEMPSCPAEYPLCDEALNTLKEQGNIVTLHDPVEEEIDDGDEIGAGYFLHETEEEDDLMNPELPFSQEPENPEESHEDQPQAAGRQRSWTDAEKEILLHSGSAREALENYRDNFPDSPRGDKPISSMWYHFKKTGQLKFSFKIDQSVRIIDPDLPQHGKIGRALELRQNTVLVRVGPSTIWVSRDSLEVVPSASKN